MGFLVTFIIYICQTQCLELGIQVNKAWPLPSNLLKSSGWSLHVYVGRVKGGRPIKRVTFQQ